MRERLKSIWKIAACTFASFALAASVQAQGLGGLEYRGFDSDIVLHQDSSFTVTETISGKFTEPRHGIFRFIPYRYEREGGLPMTVRINIESVRLNDEPVPYKWFREGNFRVAQIGDPDLTITGPFEYTIVYRVERAIIFGTTQDELYWNVMGTAWDAPISAVSGLVTVEGAANGQVEAACFAGALGENRPCSSNVETRTARFSASEPFTLSVKVTKGVLTEPGTYQKARWWLQDNWDVFAPIIPLLAFIVLFHRWRHHGRDPKSRHPVIAEYTPPEGLSAMETGTLTDATMHPQDFAAGIVELAALGYIKITEEKKGLLSGTEYTVTRLKPTGDSLRPIQKKLLDGIFGGAEEVKMSDRRTELAKLREEIASDIYESMATEGYYIKNPKTSRVMYVVLGVVVVIAGAIFGLNAYDVTLRPIVLISLIVTGAFFFIFAPLMPKKSEKGAIANDIARGFKLFMATAEKYRSEWQEKEGIFEKYLPYAVAFGIVGKWAAAFKAVHPEASAAPSWYVFSNGSVGDISSIGDNISSFASFAGSVSAPSSSGSSGGGFSGGGFGGGGGGSW